jgi:hypothetical protein
VLLDALFAASIMVVALGTVVSTLTAGAKVGRFNRETALALNAAESAVETVASRAFSEAFASFSATAATADAPGRYFSVTGLGIRTDDADGFVGEILFPGAGPELYENADDVELGMPRDLNGDSDIDGIDHAGDYRILPIRVRIEWVGVSGPRELEIVSTIANY